MAVRRWRRFPHAALWVKAGGRLWGYRNFFQINLRKLLIAGELSDFDPLFAAQNIGNKRLRYQNIDFKELSSSIRLSCDDYCEAIVSVSICGAQGQMSQELGIGLWITVGGEIGWVESPQIPSFSDRWKRREVPAVP